jgi:hypothetical protein
MRTSWWIVLSLGLVACESEGTRPTGRASASAKERRKPRDEASAAATSAAPAAAPPAKPDPAALEAAAKDLTDEGKQAAAARLLAAAGKDAVSAIEKVVRDEKTAFQAAAESEKFARLKVIWVLIEGLGAVGKDTLPFLHQLHDEIEGTRIQACAQIERLGDRCS